VTPFLTFLFIAFSTFTLPRPLSCQGYAVFT
jgi:hypothetical protein